MEKRNWEKTRFAKRIRISEENLNFIRMTKINKTLAGRLGEIIKKYRLENAKLEPAKNSGYCENIVSEKNNIKFIKNYKQFLPSIKKLSKNIKN